MISLIACMYMSSSLINTQNYVNESKTVSSVEFSTEDIWRSAYRGDYNLTQKMCLRNDPKNNEEVLNIAMIMAYLFYRMDDLESVENIFKSVDQFIETNVR